MRRIVKASLRGGLRAQQRGRAGMVSKYSTGFHGIKPPDLRTKSQERNEPWLSPPKGVPNQPKAKKPKRASIRRDPNTPLLTAFGLDESKGSQASTLRNPAKASKAQKVAAKLTRRMRDVIVEKR